MHGKPTKQGRYEGTKFAGWNAIKLDAERVNRLKKKKDRKSRSQGKRLSIEETQDLSRIENDRNEENRRVKVIRTVDRSRGYEDRNCDVQ